MAKNAKRAGNEFISNTKAFNNYSKGWNLAVSGFLTFLAVVIIVLAINIIGRLGGLNESFFGSVIIPVLWGFLLTSPIQIGSQWIFLKAARKEKYDVADMFSIFKRNYWNAVIASFLTFAFVVIGLILFIIPGIIIMVRLAFVGFLIVDKKMEALDAIKKSWKMTKGHSWTIFGMGLLSILIIFAGLVLFIFPVLFAFMWIIASFAVLYNSVLVGKR